ncbi:MAG: toll/interleukin-1 receptor domain-containing protein, partial [Bosea sp. (in: a-proteobacteria)]
MTGDKQTWPTGNDLFVSYATSDAREIAENVVVDMERRGLKCWIAPRNIPAGTKSWAAEIVRAIRDCDNFLLLLSEAANVSEEIEKELSEAARHRKTVFVIRISDIEPSDGLGYHLNRVQWRDLFRNREDVLNEISGRVLALKEAKAAQAGLPYVAPVIAPVIASAPAAPVPPPAAKSKLPMIAAGVGALAAAALGAVFLLRPAPTPAPSPAAVATHTAPAIPAPPAATAPVAAPATPAALRIETPAGLDTAQFEKIYRALQEALPQSRNLTRQAELFMRAATHKAIAVAPPTSYYRRTGVASPAEAIRLAIEGCAVMTGLACRAIVANDDPLPAGDPEGIMAKSTQRMVYAGSFDANMVPALTDVVRSRLDIAGYASSAGPKAAALHPSNGLFVALGAANQFDAEQKALADCDAEAKRQPEPLTCLLYASGNDVVLPRRLTAPFSLQ